MGISGRLPVLFILCAAILAVPALGQGIPPDRLPNSEEKARGQWLPGPDDVTISRIGVNMPFGRIILARKGSDHCALKFTKTWSGETSYDRYISYEFFSQSDSSGDFSNSNAKTGTGELYFPRPRMWMGIGYYKGAKKDLLQCGGIRFKSFGVGSIAFGDAELAPTPWTSVMEVNIHDPRIRWYRKDTSRITWIVSIDQFWQDGWEDKGTLCRGNPK